ncbi:type II toxin-antitoxin system HicB family antitoxin [Thalassomonas actiniarum]|uniref:Type II toxin-antitoxin system HicB family antitoxin n=1 Tax=Thalassomonas actiniarum TaxID=485447 RepID=A0AAE9YXU0_9GAMM|nr:type II toxin-antitoxin system HicB family antitoxin [Thalassomonas actiniarum]WDE01577.1 type II toxin-antitoxin system HicB family antitoxin [Thalassomonas actiniarum]
MKYPVKLEKELTADHYQITVPDLPGCLAKARTIDEGLTKIDQAIASHMSILAEYGEAIPTPRSIDYYVNQAGQLAQSNGAVWAIIEIDISPYLGKSHKINVTLPELLIKKIDHQVAQSPAYKTRSGFIATACLSELQK